jgi:hypothetical protein
MTSRSARVGRLLLLLTAIAGTAHAQAPPPPTLRAGVFSPYEKETIDDALTKLEERREPSPEGKTVEGVDVVTLEVIEERDPVPRFLNWFHATTRPYIVEREMLLRPGARYTQVTVDESVRNLRKSTQLSLVLAIPIQGHAPGTVRILVITKDVWSLRLNSRINASSAGLEQLTLQPSEINFLGTHQSASALFILDPASYTIGAGYRVPRVGGTRVIVTATANVVVNRASGALEGSNGQVLAYQPLYSARTPWAWDSAMAWENGITRRFVNAAETTFNSKLTPDNDAIPWEYHERTFLKQDSVTRSFGWGSKHDVSLGGTMDLRSYRTDDLSRFDPAAAADFVRRAVPRSDTRVGPFLQYHAYTTRYVRVLDSETLGLQEDYRLGPEVYMRVYPIVSALGSTRDVLGVFAAAQYTLAIRDGLARVSVESTTEAEAERVSDGAVAGSARLSSPRFGFGRLVFDARVLSRYRNYLNRQTFLGGSTRLRGYPTNFFAGKDLVEYNLELRTRPITVLTSQLGAALFYDVGDAFDGFENLHPKQAVGVGFRILFPQLDRFVLRGDVGFPMGEGARIRGVAPAAFFIAFEQAFGVPSISTLALPSGP